MEPCIDQGADTAILITSLLALFAGCVIGYLVGRNDRNG